MTDGRRHALVTGGGSGIGRSVAIGLAEAGWQVTILGRNEARLAAVARDHAGMLALGCDVGDEAAVAAAVGQAIERHGPVGLLVNGAGIVETAPFGKSPDALWDRLWRTNVMGAVHMSRAVLPAMRQLPAARIVNIASTASLKGYAYVSAYTATKHALLGMTRALALELVGTAITVNAVCPGYADTDIVHDAVATIVAKTGRTEAEAMATFTGANPQGRLIDPAEILGTVLWLASDAARSVTGQAIVVAGGEIM